jgi:protein NrfC
MIRKHSQSSPVLRKINRRTFLKYSGIIAIGVNWYGIDCFGQQTAVGASKGYLLIDSKKCQGCQTCMLACSLVHEGEENLSLARIQVVQNPFGKYPSDIRLAQCRQCIDPACLLACPTGALNANAQHGYVRIVDSEKCIGCRACVRACPYKPGRGIWNFTSGYAQKCDLCINAPYWDEVGGHRGKQACVEACPIGAIIFTCAIPRQCGDAGYDVNLRDLSWKILGYPLD